MAHIRPHANPAPSAPPFRSKIQGSLLALAVTLPSGTGFPAVKEAGFIGRLHPDTATAWERVDDEKRPISAGFLMGIVGGDTASRIQPESLNVYLPAGTWSHLEVSIQSGDGRYQYSARYPVPALSAEGRYFLDFRSKHAGELRAYRPRQLAVLSLARGKSGGTEGRYLISNWGKPVSGAAFLLLNASHHEQVQVAFQRSRRPYACGPIPETLFAFFQICLIPGEPGLLTQAAGDAKIYRRFATPLDPVTLKFAGAP